MDLCATRRRQTRVNFVAQPLDPDQFAEDERVLRELSFARFNPDFALTWGSPPAGFASFDDAPKPPGAEAHSFSDDRAQARRRSAQLRCAFADPMPGAT